MPEPQRELTFRFLSQPGDVNFGGKVHGGSVMKWMDQAGYACAVGWCGGYAVTASVGGMSFLEPIRVGDLVEVSARVVLTGRTSISVAVEVDSIDLATRRRARTTRCVMVFVAVDEAGRPVEVPGWTPVTEADVRLAAYARTLKNELAGAQSDLDRL